MTTLQCVRRVLVATVFLLITVPFAASQERAPNGEIYRELLPFVGLNGVRLEIHGLGGVIWNVRTPGVGDTETEITGLSRTEHKQLLEAIKADATEALQVGRIPLVEAGSAIERPPRLVVALNSHRFRPDDISADVTIELMEAAHLLREPAAVVWSSTWTVRASGIFSNAATLATWLRETTRNQVKQFAQLYVRAHARLAYKRMDPPRPSSCVVMQFGTRPFPQREPDRV